MRRNEPPLYVPAEFEAAHLEEARRIVLRSRSRGRVAPRRPRLDSSGLTTGTPRRRLRGLVVLLHLTAGLLALALTAVTGTLFIGLGVLVIVALSLAVMLALLPVGPGHVGEDRAG